MTLNIPERFYGSIKNNIVDFPWVSCNYLTDKNEKKEALKQTELEKKRMFLGDCQITKLVYGSTFVYYDCRYEDKEKQKQYRQITVKDQEGNTKINLCTSSRCFSLESLFMDNKEFDRLSKEKPLKEETIHMELFDETYGFSFTSQRYQNKDTILVEKIKPHYLSENNPYSFSKHFQNLSQSIHPIEIQYKQKIPVYVCYNEGKDKRQTLSFDQVAECVDFMLQDMDSFFDSYKKEPKKLKI